MSLFPRSRFQWRSHDIASDLDKLTDTTRQVQRSMRSRAFPSATPARHAGAG